MKSVIASGKTIEKAIEEGLKELNTTFENVDINVISEGGFFKKATVELTLSEDKVSVPHITDVEVKPEIVSKETNKEVVSKTETTQTSQATQQDIKSVQNVESSVEDSQDLNIKQDIEKLDAELEQLVPQEKKVSPKTENIELAQEEIKKFLSGFIYVYNIVADIAVKYVDRSFEVSINGENLGVLIGYHGDTLDAIQYILSNYIYSKTGTNYKIMLDIENYKFKRAESLANMAAGLAQKVIETKRSLKLEFMNAYERKVIHTKLQDMEHISTHSEGEEPRRFVVIDYID